MTTRGELHFFPGSHLLLWLADGAVRLRAEAWGGEDPDASVDYGEMKPRKTAPGRYIVHSFAPYKTLPWGPWDTSKIRWGTKLRVERGEVLYETGSRTEPWRPVSTVIKGVTTDQIRRYFRRLFGDKSRYDFDGDYIPEVWVFNDFGPKAVRYFRDKNNNGRLDRDKGERLSGEMIHTTPKSEGQAERRDAVTLEPSHGCIHVAPASRELFAGAGAFRRGTVLIVHTYDEDVPAGLR